MEAAAQDRTVDGVKLAQNWVVQRSFPTLSLRVYSVTEIIFCLKKSGVYCVV